MIEITGQNIVDIQNIMTGVFGDLSPLIMLILGTLLAITVVEILLNALRHK